MASVGSPETAVVAGASAGSIDSDARSSEVCSQDRPKLRSSAPSGDCQRASSTAPGVLPRSIRGSFGEEISASRHCSPSAPSDIATWMPWLHSSARPALLSRCRLPLNRLPFSCVERRPTPGSTWSRESSQSDGRASPCCGESSSSASKRPLLAFHIGRTRVSASLPAASVFQIRSACGVCAAAVPPASKHATARARALGGSAGMADRERMMVSDLHDPRRFRQMEVFGADALIPDSSGFMFI